MDIIWTLLLFIVGLILVLYFAEKLVQGTVGTSAKLGISTFLISVIFIGFDPENLVVGAVGSYEQVSGIALGSIIGAAMVAIALAFGITALISPMRFQEVPRQVILVPILATILFGILILDERLSRLDGIILFTGYIIAIFYLLRLNKRDINVISNQEAAESLEKAKKLGKWKSIGLLVISLAGIIIGSEMLVNASKTVIDLLGLTDTVFGMTILAFLVSIEELARELPAALKGKPEISFGNVVGSVLAFFLFNAGIISIISPIPINSQVLYFYFPVALVTMLVVSGFMLFKSISRLAGAVLVLLYLIFIFGTNFI